MRSETRYDEGPEGWTNDTLIARVRRDDPAALRELYRRFTPLLWKVARQAQVPPGVRDDVITDALTDSVLHLLQPTVAVPGNLAGYLVAAFRHRLANDRRATHRRDRASAAAASLGDGERVVREVCSEATLRASAGPAAELAPPSPTVQLLAQLLDAHLGDAERKLLRWVAASIPQRLIAEWLGITHNAARMRVLRLRERLMDVAVRGDAAWSPAEREAVYAFFRRSGMSERAWQALGSEPTPGRGRRRGGAALRNDTQSREGT